MALERTSDPATALAWARELLGPGSGAEFLLAPERFEYAERESTSMSFTLGGERVIGVAFGPNPPLRDEWQACMISDSRFGDRLGRLERRDGWDFYSRPTAATREASELETLIDDGAIEELLRDHAPHSAVWPGNHEIVAWYGLRDGQGLACVAAVVRWESGCHVLSSVATRTDARGRGLARTLVRGIVADLHARGVAWLGLGVGHENLVAQRLYRDTGFAPRAAFTVYAAPGRRHGP